MRTINKNFSADGYELWIDGTGAEHIINRHGEKGQHDSSMASRENKELISQVTNFPDGGELIRDDSGNLKLSNRFFNEDGTKAPQIRLHKVIDGDTVYVSECVPDAKNKRIYITSAYKKSSTNQLLNIDSTESPQPTSETSFDSSATNSSIPQPDAKINTSDKKSYTVPEIMKLAKEKVKGYEGMNESKKLMVRGVIRRALANGFSESDAVRYARVAARSGVAIKFDKARCSMGLVDNDGNLIFADGFYDRASNEIVVNPEGTRSTSKLLIHELAHAIYKTRTGAVILEKGVKNLTKDQINSIEEKYGAVYKGEAREYKLKDEKNAHYAEDILGDDKLLEKLLEDKPTLMDKILNFFKGAESDYADDERLSKEARKLYRHYKKLFDQFAERNQDNNLLPDYGEAYVREDSIADFALSSANIKKRFAEYDKPITLADVKKLLSIGQKSINKFTTKDIEVAKKWAYKFYKEFGVKSPFFRAWFGDWRAKSIDPAEIVKFDYGEYLEINYNKRDVINCDMKRKITIDDDTIGDSEHYATINGDKKQIKKLLGKIDEILEKAIWLDTQVSGKTSNNKKGSTQFVHYLYTPISVNGAPFIAKLAVEEYGFNTNQRAYNLQRIEMSTLSRAQYSQIINENRGKYAYSADALSISQLYEFVKQYDKKFTSAPEITAETAKYMLNDDGTPKVFYHGTNAKFTEFKPEEISHREGSYFFAENREDAEAYGNNIYEVYLSGRNFANYDDQPTEFYRLKSKREQVEWLKARKYDGWYADMDSGGWGEVSVFSPEQIKSAKSNIGTFSSGEKNINYALPDNMDPSKVTVSKNRLAQMRANNQGEKVFYKKDILTALSKVDAISKLTQKQRGIIADRLCQGYRKRRDR